MIKGYILNNENVTVILENGALLPYFKKSDPIIQQITNKGTLNNLVDGLFELFEDFRIRYRDYINDELLFNTLIDALRYLDINKFNKLYKFAGKLANNPSEESRKQLFRFLQDKSIEINEDGYIVAYKAVRKDLYDIYSGTIKYELNKWIRIPRNEVDPNPKIACSTGLHIGTLKYAKQYGDIGSSDNILLKVIVDPADVVAVPIIEAEKCRVCRLKPIEIVNDELPKVIKTNRNTYVKTYKPIDFDIKRALKPEKVNDRIKQILSKVDKGYSLSRVINRNPVKEERIGLMFVKDNIIYYYEKSE